MSALFDPETGEVLTSGEGQCQTCSGAIQERLVAEQDLQRVERDLRKARREVARLTTELTKQRIKSPNMRAAEGLFHYWATITGRNLKTVVFGEKRRKAALDALERYDAEYLVRAIDWTAFAPATSSQETERAALIKVMNEAIERVDEDTAVELRGIYREATKKVTRYDEFDLILRDESQIEKRHDAAERVNAPTLMGPAWRREFGTEEPNTDAYPDQSRF